jgi:hypothetical protein
VAAPRPRQPGNVSIGPSGATTCAVWSSHDGGRTWNGGRLEETGLGSNQPGAGTQPPAAVPSEFGDPGNVISADQNTVFDRHGNAWYQCIDFGARTGDVKVFVYKSTDGGRTWGTPVAGFSEEDTRIQLDRSFLAIDNSGGPRNGTLYLTWETMFYQAYLPEVYSRSSTDGGKTWGPVVRVDSDDNRAQWDPRQYPVVGPDGTLYIVYDAATFVSPGPGDPGLTPLKVMVGRSTDGGKTFTNTVVEPDVHRIMSPDEAFSYFVETIGAIAADPAHPGRLAVAWPDDRSGESRILMRSSSDGGRTWSGMIDVGDDPAGKGNQHDHVALAYLPDGRLLATWRDRRYSGGAFGNSFDVFTRVFDPASDGTLRPGATVRVTDAPQPDGEGTHGSMPTEYLGLAADARGAAVAWNEMRGSLLDDVIRRVPVGAFGPASALPAPGARRTCVSRRRFPIRIRVPRGIRVRRVTVRVNGGRVTVRRVGARLVADVSLRRLPKGRFAVHIRIVSRSGRVYTGVRRYRTCTAKRPTARPPHV